MCRLADEPCPRGDACRYAAAATRFFESNRLVLSRDAFALALRDIIRRGPSKTTRVPLLAGPTNTGKTTLLLPFDQVFKFRHVFHKPALGSKFALRNLAKGKRFIMWDDYRPVEYAVDTVPVPTFLSLFTGQPFEVQMSQSFNDGNLDFEWRRGAVMTAKAQGLWDLRGDVTAEDVKHMQSRVEVFACNAQVPNMADTEMCAVCMCVWIRDGAAARDAAPLVQPALGWPDGEGEAGRIDVHGAAAFLEAARIPMPVAAALLGELRDLGVVHVSEVAPSDWPLLRSWASLRPFEQRRLRGLVGNQ